MVNVVYVFRFRYLFATRIFEIVNIKVGGALT